jgi:hypothetical protein
MQMKEKICLTGLLLGMNHGCITANLTRSMLQCSGGKCFTDDVDVAETTVKRLLCCRFRLAGKVMGQVYRCWWRIYQEINVSSRFKYHMFYVLCPFVTYLLTPSYIKCQCVPHRKHITKANWLMMFREITPACENHTKHINVFCRKMQSSCYVKASGTYSNI